MLTNIGYITRVSSQVQANLGTPFARPTNGGLAAHIRSAEDCINKRYTGVETARFRTDPVPGSA